MSTTELSHAFFELNATLGRIKELTLRGSSTDNPLTEQDLYLLAVEVEYVLPLYRAWFDAYCRSQEMGVLPSEVRVAAQGYFSRRKGVLTWDDLRQRILKVCVARTTSFLPVAAANTWTYLRGRKYVTPAASSSTPPEAACATSGSEPRTGSGR